VVLTDFEESDMRRYTGLGIDAVHYRIEAGKEKAHN